MDSFEVSARASKSALSERELQVLYHVQQGSPNKRIAYVLGISEHTVRCHVRVILKKTHSLNRVEAALKTLGKDVAGSNHSPVLKFLYTNHRGELATRSVVNPVFFYGATEYYPDVQWLVSAFDLEKDAQRTFALNNIQAFMRNDEIEKS